MNDLISVILPVYDREQVLPDCIRSLKAQTYQNLEILLIDDGSTDSTPQLCRQYAAEDPRIRLLTGAHAGVSAARNLGLDAAQGTFVLFVDSDDAIHPLLAETLHHALLTTDASIAGSCYHNVLNSQWHTVERLIKEDPGPGRTACHDDRSSIDALCRGGTPLNAMGGVMMRRSLIGHTRFRTDLFIGEDFYFIYENLLKGASTVFLEQHWYYARIHRGNSSNDFSYEGFWTRSYRRKLVWTSEEALGRPENAIPQKQDAFSIFLHFLHRGRMDKEEIQRMCAVMKEHKKNSSHPSLAPDGFASTSM